MLNCTVADVEFAAVSTALMASVLDGVKKVLLSVDSEGSLKKMPFEPESRNAPDEPAGCGGCAGIRYLCEFDDHAVVVVRKQHDGVRDDLCVCRIRPGAAGPRTREIRAGAKIALRGADAENAVGPEHR